MCSLLKEQQKNNELFFCCSLALDFPSAKTAPELSA